MRTILALLLIAVHGSGLASDRCAPVTPSEILELENCVKHWYRLPSDQKIRITDSNAVDSASYRKLIFRTNVPSPMLILYLTPDGKHLVSGVMDLAIDPAVAQRKPPLGSYKNQLQSVRFIRYSLPSDLELFYDSIVTSVRTRALSVLVQ